MRRFLKTVILILIVFVGSWLLFNRERIKSPSDLVTLAKENFTSIKIPTFQASTQLDPHSNSFSRKTADTIRIATFKLNGKTGAAQKHDAVRLMTEICKQFDVIAIQEINPRNPEWISRLVGSLKESTGDDYKFITSAFFQQRQFATLYNSRTIELDQSHFYSVNDPDRLFQRPPLVAWFRTQGVESSKAFTFSLANVQLDSKRSGQELQQLGNLYRAIRQDGRGEDDVIVVGDFQTGERGLGLIKEKSGLQSVAANRPTDTMKTAQFDNVLFSPVATVEFAGESGVFDFMQHFNLFLQDSLAISEHLPVWAEFSVYEGVVPGRVASEKTNRR